MPFNSCKNVIASIREALHRCAALAAVAVQSLMRIGLRSNYRGANEHDYRLVVATVEDVLTAHPAASCLDCLVRHTRLRVDDVLRQIDVLQLGISEGRCGWCAEVGPIVAHSGQSPR